MAESNTVKLCILTLLDMVSELNENDISGTLVFSEVCQAEEGGLGEALNCDVTQPHEEGLTLFVEDAREAPACLLTVQAIARVEFEVLRGTVLNLEELHESLTEVYSRLLAAIYLTLVAIGTLVCGGGVLGTDIVSSGSGGTRFEAAHLEELLFLSVVVILWNRRLHH